MSFCVNMQGVCLTVIMNSENRAGYRARFYIFTFKLVLSEDFSKDESNKWSGNKELPEEGHWKVSYDELTECRKYL